MSDDDNKLEFSWIDGPDSAGPNPATREEWDAIDALCAAEGWASVNRALSRILVARRGDQIVGFHVMQMVPHLEPQWVATEERGTGLAAQLADQMVAFMEGAKAAGWMVIATNPHAEKLCKARGMVRVKAPVYITPSEKVQ